LYTKGTFQVAKPKTSFINLLCGPIESVDIAKKVRLPSLCFTTFSATIWAIIAINGLFSPSGYGYWAIVYSVVLALVAWGLYKMRKEAAVVAMAVALVGLLSGGGFFKVVVDIILLLVSVAAIRGTFAHSLLTRKPRVTATQ
jgi:hypothetical protein